MSGVPMISAKERASFSTVQVSASSFFLRKTLFIVIFTAKTQISTQGAYTKKWGEGGGAAADSKNGAYSRQGMLV